VWIPRLDQYGGGGLAGKAEVVSLAPVDPVAGLVDVDAGHLGDAVGV
jgi:hypothetical protein